MDEETRKKFGELEEQAYELFGAIKEFKMELIRKDNYK